MTSRLGGRDDLDGDAILTDRYLEMLLAAGALGRDAAPAPLGVDPLIRGTAERLVRSLPRLHPSFRFEEALAGKLLAAALRARLPAAAGGEWALAPLRGGIAPAEDDSFIAYIDDANAPSDGDRMRPFLIGGALTSAALSIAGAAYVAWRRRRPVPGPMARAARAARRTGSRRRLD